MERREGVLSEGRVKYKRKGAVWFSKQHDKNILLKKKRGLHQKGVSGGGGDRASSNGKSGP